MFTVLHKEANGNETLHQAKAVRWQQDELKEIGLYPGMYADLVDGGNLHIGISKCGSSKDLGKNEVFVMNESGKTVAHYPL